MAAVRLTFRALWSLAAPVLLGALVAFVAIAFVSPMLPGQTQPGNRQEPPETRAYLLAVMNNDAPTINRLQLPQNVVDRAVIRKQLSNALKMKADTLTFLGGSQVGQVGAWSYVLGVTGPDGQPRLVPVLVTTVGDKIAALQGGSSGDEQPQQPGSSVAPQ
ncbi:MAG: hypothetical protein ACJ77N_08430 [Chloroflexota bacterium]|jgi:hypothetical protein